MTSRAAAPLATWENEGGQAAPTVAPVGEGLDWASFIARFYPHARKHDYVPLAAYVEYRNERSRP